MNVIIGENGSGKSTLLKLISGNDLESHVKAAKRNNRIEIPALPNRSKTVFQGELFNDYNNNKDLYLTDALFFRNQLPRFQVANHNVRKSGNGMGAQAHRSKANA